MTSDERRINKDTSNSSFNIQPSSLLYSSRFRLIARTPFPG